MASAPLYPLTSVDNALQLLVLLSRGSPLRVTEAARALNVAPSTAHRLLAMLEHRGFARHGSATRAYLPGETFAAVARDVLGEVDLARIAQPLLEELGRTYQESVLLGVLDAQQGVVFVAGRESEQALRVGGHFDRSFIAHATASGLVLLSRLSREELHARYPSERLTSPEPGALARRSDLERELEAVRARRYAFVIDTNVSGVSAVAVPLVVEGKVTAALTIIAPSSRFNRAKLRACVAPLQRAALRLGRDYRASLLRS